MARSQILHVLRRHLASSTASSLLGLLCRELVELVGLVLQVCYRSDTSAEALLSSVTASVDWGRLVQARQVALPIGL